jgi:archaellum component FlaC
MPSTLNEFLEKALNEGKGNISISKAQEKILVAVQDMKGINDQLADIRRNFEAVDNAVGGTSMMKGINKAHTKASKALNDFAWELKSVVKEYETLLKEK